MKSVPREIEDDQRRISRRSASGSGFAENEIKILASINFYGIPVSAAYLFRTRWSDI